VARLSALLLSVVAFLTFAHAAPVPKEADRPAFYFPTRVGDTWVWAWVGDKNEFTEVVRKVDVDTEKEEKVITVEVLVDGKRLNTKRFSLSAKGVFALSHDDHKYDKPWCVLKAPYRPGVTWDVDVRDPFGVSVKSTHAIGEFEWVEVPAGKFRALRVETEHDGDNPRLTATSWYAPGVGQVKMVCRSGAGKAEGSVVLKSFTTGKE